MQKRILIFEAYPFFSGSQRITLNVCKILKQNNYHVTLLLVDDRFGAQQMNFSPVVDEIKFIKASRHILSYGEEDSWFSKNKFFKSVFLGLLPFYFNCLKIINSRRYDVLYCCDPRGATMMLLSAWLFKKKTILHFHGKNRLPKKLSLLFLKVFDKVICVSRAVADSLPEAGDKVVIHNGIDFLQYDNIDVDSAISEADKLGINKDSKLKFLYTGLLRPHKGLHHVIFNLSRLKKEYPEKDFVLLVIGSAKTEAEENFKNLLIQYSQDHGIEQSICWLGWKNNVLSWMHYADYFIFSSIDKELNKFKGFGDRIESTEGLPTVLIESSICNLYSIASGVTGVSEIVTESFNGTVYNSNDSEALYTALKKVIDESPHFTGFPSRDDFSIHAFESKILSIFTEFKK